MRVSAEQAVTADASERLRARLAQLKGVIETTSRFGRELRLAWRSGSREIAHLHSVDVIDIRLPATLQRQWRGDVRLRPRPRRSDWIECRFHSHDDIEFAAMLVGIAAASGKSVSRAQR